MKLSTLRRKLPVSIYVTKQTRNSGTSSAYDLLVFSRGGKALFTVVTDDLLDADGNRFEDDL